MRKVITYIRIFIISTLFVSCSSYQLASYYIDNDGIYESNERGIDYEVVFKDYVDESLSANSSDTDSGNLPYNLVDNMLKQTEVKTGSFQGLNPIEVFNRFADMKENLLHIKDLIKQAIQHSIYRLKPSGKVYEGDYEVAMDEEELVKYLIDEDHQDDLLVLEKKLKSKKLAAV